VTTPQNGIAAPPGYYYLVVNKKTAHGPVPSVARMVHVGAESDDSAEALQPYPDDPAAPVSGSATPDDDTSNAAVAQQAASNAAKSTPAPAAGPATEAADTATEAYQKLRAVPARTTSPARSTPVLPVVAVAMAVSAVFSGRRWMRFIARPAHHR
jgi:cobalamin biosynthesis Mg chelatase CobN